MKLKYKKNSFIIMITSILVFIPSISLAYSNNVCDVSVTNEERTVHDELESIKVDYFMHNDVTLEYFNDVTWIQRDGIWSLSISPKNFVRMSFSNDILIKSWNELKENFSNDVQWSQYKDNEDILFEQYKCHFFKAKIKKRWNIEPFRESIDRLCN
ncbi:DUF2599 domain-containing protein [Anaerococcus sp.]|uniref:DUF2599 domain-containing protein n=1 Tax=Anaerococcus sp. TaxID=1872515 RepID=UPI00258B17E6|nr:DUF2599 domain-containing protein [Anaerococcus sp.]MDU3212293.1 DUF2599 domain-containing protein [Anaerococcus sp.]